MGRSSNAPSQQGLLFNHYTTPSSVSQEGKSDSCSPDLPSLPKAVAEPIGYRSSFPISSNEYRYVPSHYNKAVAKQPIISLPTTKREQPAPDVSTYQWIAEDPTSKQRHHEKRVRTQLDVENRKEDIQKLKEFGGACLWCHRSKKKCDPAQICQPCQTNKRKCVRSSSQLCLTGHFKPPDFENSLMSFGPPSQEALNAMYFMAEQAFSNSPLVKAHISIQRDNKMLGLEVTKDDMDPSKSETRRLINDFTFRASSCVHCPELEKLTEDCSTHPLVLAAIKMSKAFMTIRNLATTQVHFCTADTHIARSTLLLVLIVSILNLTGMSDCFTLELCEALRRRNYERTNPSSKHQLAGACNLSPVSLATELYYQIVNGLLQLTENPVIALIFKDVETHLQEVHATLKSILAFLNAIHPKRTKRTGERTPGGQATTISAVRYFELVFWVEWVHTNQHLRSTTANEQGCAPELISLDVETLLQGGIGSLETFEKSQKNPQRSPVSAKVPAQSISPETETDIASNSEIFETGIFDDILLSDPWGWSVADDFNLGFPMEDQ
ncbi:hypothetical protein N7507_000468 [Penicillium longicatenatum]|nr:hypothetical protein N7507_000468 [Penicillium longicatenatum]